jgi:hypothetical protein
MELMKPTFHGCHPKNTEIRRSSIVQKLSLLLGFFEWVSPSAPNAVLCNNCKTTIKDVLNTTLDGPPLGQELPSVLDWNFSTQVDFNFDLLDTFDWLRGDA